jgi:protein TonB
MKAKALFWGFLILFLLGTKTQSLAQTGNEGTVSAEAENEQPAFPGGIIAMLKYIKANTKYPATALEAKKSGKCNVKFLVNTNGTISDVTILDGIENCPECDAEAIRVVKSMPKWKPGKIAGKAVALYYNLTVKFSLPKK